jgi:hypothetical protein
MPLIDRWVVHHAFETIANRIERGVSSGIATCAINLQARPSATKDSWIMSASN